MVRRAAIETEGAAAPTGMDANIWWILRHLFIIVA